MLDKRNPVYKEVEYKEPSFVKPAKVIKPKPEDLLPWRMFYEFGEFTCPRCRHNVNQVYIIAKTQALAAQVFEKNRGLSSGCMAYVMRAPDHRIATTDGGWPNPVTEAPLEVVSGAGTTLTRPPLNISHWRVFSFTSKNDWECGCGRKVHFILVIAMDSETAYKRIGRYGMCATCLCDTLCFDRYIIQTTHGGPP